MRIDRLVKPVKAVKERDGNGPGGGQPRCLPLADRVPPVAVYQQVGANRTRGIGPARGDCVRRQDSPRGDPPLCEVEDTDQLIAAVHWCAGAVIETDASHAPRRGSTPTARSPPSLAAPRRPSRPSARLHTVNRRASGPTRGRWGTDTSRGRGGGPLPRSTAPLQAPRPPRQLPSPRPAAEALIQVQWLRRSACAATLYESAFRTLRNLIAFATTLTVG